MSKLQRYKDYSIDEINENNENVFFDEVYEIRGIDVNGDEYISPYDDDDVNYNPFDLKEVVKLLIKKSKTDINNLFIVKVTTERIPDETIERIKIGFEANKYNL